MAMFFCPFCGSLLLFSLEKVGEGRFFCPTCSYVVPLDTGDQLLTVTHDFRMFNSHADTDTDTVEAEPVTDAPHDNFGGDGSGQVISISCENEEKGCQSQKAFYVQTQIRSADEPATIFYKCVECGYTWRQD